MSSLCQLGICYLPRNEDSLYFQKWKLSQLQNRFALPTHSPLFHIRLPLHSAFREFAMQAVPAAEEGKMLGDALNTVKIQVQQMKRHLVRCHYLCNPWIP